MTTPQSTSADPTSAALSSSAIRQAFIDFFVEKRAHTFWPSSPVVPQSDPTLLFTNAGMNQFKPIFLGQANANTDLGKLKRAANSQKCIRAGGKHNDLEDVGRDTYHHTFFEMLGNWSFGDYFKKDAIAWAWELLVERWGIDADRLCATYFAGDPSQGLEPDEEARDHWLRVLPADRVLPFGMKDNFWEMGDTGPCGPCSEIHFDSRSDAERKRTPVRDLVNKDHPDVIEIWNLVFIQYDRQSSGLRPLPAKHVDTGMGLERITRVLQSKRSNYDTDLFTPLFSEIQYVCKCAPYTGDLEKREDIAYRVIADHARALVFAIADGAHPGNEGRGYVLRRILRRAVRHGAQTLGAKGPFLCELVPTIVEQMGGFFPEINANSAHVYETIRNEEEAFGRTLRQGVEYWMEAFGRALISPRNPDDYPRLRITSSGRMVDPNNDARGALDSDSVITLGIVSAKGIKKDYVYHGYLSNLNLHEIKKEYEYKTNHDIKSEDAFKLHDTYGFPIDLTCVMAQERGLEVDVAGFERLMEQAREKARAAGSGAGGSSVAADPAATLPAEAIGSLVNMGVKPTDDAPKYDPALKPCKARVKAIWNGGDFDENATTTSTRPGQRIAIILDRTNYYAESGGPVGDTGRLMVTREARTSARDKHEGGEFKVEGARASGGYVLHIGRVVRGEIRVGDTLDARLERNRRRQIMANHTATHLLNFALRETLGDKIDQKGSLVAPDRLRFDFSWDAALTDEQIDQVERIVRERITADEPVYAEQAPLEQAREINGLRAVFGETYPDPVRVVSIGAPVAQMLEEPDSPLWRMNSIEFCGGAHLARTSEAAAFAILAEEAVARGVRRIEATTGEAAQQAIDAGAQAVALAQQAVEAQRDHLSDAIEEAQVFLQNHETPVRDRRAAQTLIKQAQGLLRSASKEQAKAGREQAVEQARKIAASATGDIIVAQVNAEGDRQALLAALDAIVAKHADAAVMLLSADEDAGKVAIVARVAKPIVAKGLKAGDWVRETARIVGGKGGGKPDAAQGGGTDIAKIGDAIERARTFADISTS